MKRIACLFAAVACLFVAASAHAQNDVYTFYDGDNGTGNIPGTYTGPLITSFMLVGEHYRDVGTTSEAGQVYVYKKN